MPLILPRNWQYLYHILLIFYLTSLYDVQVLSELPGKDGPIYEAVLGAKLFRL